MITLHNCEELDTNPKCLITFAFNKQENHPRRLFINGCHGDLEGNIRNVHWPTLENEVLIQYLFFVASWAGFPNRWYINPCYPAKCRERYPNIHHRIIGYWEYSTITTVHMNNLEVESMDIYSVREYATVNRLKVDEFEKYVDELAKKGDYVIPDTRRLTWLLKTP